MIKVLFWKATTLFSSKAKILLNQCIISPFLVHIVILILYYCNNIYITYLIHGNNKLYVRRHNMVSCSVPHSFG